MDKLHQRLQNLGNRLVKLEEAVFQAIQHHEDRKPTRFVVKLSLTPDLALIRQVIRPALPLPINS